MRPDNLAKRRAGLVNYMALAVFKHSTNGILLKLTDHALQRIRQHSNALIGSLQLLGQRRAVCPSRAGSGF